MLFRSPRGRCKLKDNWEQTPYVVIKKLGGCPAYVVRQLGTKRVRTLHRNMLTKCPFEVTGDDETSSDGEWQLPVPGGRDGAVSEGEVIPPPYQFRNNQPQMSSSDDNTVILPPPHEFSNDEVVGTSGEESIEMPLPPPRCFRDRRQHGRHRYVPHITDNSMEDDDSSGPGEHDWPAPHRSRRISKPPVRYGEWE